MSKTLVEFTRNGNFYGKFQPHIFLQKWIKNYWVLKSDTINEETKLELKITDGHPELVFCLNTPYLHEDIHTQERLFINKSMLVGPKLKSVKAKRVDDFKPLYLIGVKFYPIGLYHFLKTSTATISNQYVAIDDLQKDWLKTLEDKLFHSNSTIIDKLDIIDRSFIQYFKSSEFEQDKLEGIFKQLSQNSNISVSNLAKQHHFSTKTLERLFVRSVGMTPKKFIKICRFNHWFSSYQKKLIYPGNHLYFDQSHLIKDCKQFTGQTPKHFKAENNPYTVHTLALQSLLQ